MSNATEKILEQGEMTLKSYKEIFKLTKRKDYVTNEYWVLVRGCKNPQPDVVVPGTMEGIPVHLDLGAFDADKVLETIVLGEGAAKISINALSNCPKLKTVQIPSTVCEIEDGTMASVNLVDIHVADENPCYTSRNGLLYNKDCSKLLRCPAGKSGEVELPDGLQEIKDFAFANCNGISKISISSSVSKIGNDAFAFVGKGALSIHAPAGSYAETYAKRKKIPLVTE